jgi:dolichyl-phosphate beta-glucosyltransferase
MSVSIVIPAYNEESRLPATLLAIVEYFQARNEDFEVLVVDDGSKDGTANVVQKYCEQHPDAPVRVASYGGNRGKGFAVRYGMLQATGDLRLFCDADLATPIEEYEIVFDRMKKDGTQVGIGSRPLRESNLIVHQPWYREQLGRFFNKIVQVLAVPGISDTQCGFKIFTAAATQDVFTRCLIDAFAFDSEALLIARRLGYEISEVPIRWSHKDGSKVNMIRDGSRMILDLCQIRWLHRRLKKSKLAQPSSVSRPKA